MAQNEASSIHENAAKSALYQQLINAPTRVSVSGTTATSALLTPGRYRVVCDVDVYLRQGTSAVTAATTDNFLPGGTVDYIFVSGAADGYLAGITGGASGTLYLTRQRPKA